MARKQSWTILSTTEPVWGYTLQVIITDICNEENTTETGIIITFPNHFTSLINQGWRGESTVGQAINNYKTTSKLFSHWLQILHVSAVSIFNLANCVDKNDREIYCVSHSQMSVKVLTSLFSLQILHSHTDSFWLLKVSTPHLLHTACNQSHVNHYRLQNCLHSTISANSRRAKFWKLKILMTMHESKVHHIGISR